MIVSFHPSELKLYSVSLDFVSELIDFFHYFQLLFGMVHKHHTSASNADFRSVAIEYSVSIFGGYLLNHTTLNAVDGTHQNSIIISRQVTLALHATWVIFFNFLWYSQHYILPF